MSLTNLPKWNGFTGTTALGKVHTHLFLLGMVIFMLVALFAKDHQLTEQKSFRVFMCVYQIGLPLMTLMLVVRGVVQVLAIELSSGMNAAISGIAGIGHILVGTGIILLLTALKKSVK